MKAKPIISGKLYLVNDCVKVEAENASHACAKFVLAIIDQMKRNLKTKYAS